jgi:hypothetical protein
MMNTHQQLERTYANRREAHAHDEDGFCIECFQEDVDRDDLRGKLALLGILELTRLAELRAAFSGRTRREEWAGILEPTQLHADLFSDDRDIRRAALGARMLIADYLNHRVVLAHPDGNNPVLADCLHVITKRTHERLAEIEKEGSALRLFAH